MINLFPRVSFTAKRCEALSARFAVCQFDQHAAGVVEEFHDGGQKFGRISVQEFIGLKGEIPFIPDLREGAHHASPIGFAPVRNLVAVAQQVVVMDVQGAQSPCPERTHRIRRVFADQAAMPRSRQRSPMGINPIQQPGKFIGARGDVVDDDIAQRIALPHVFHADFHAQLLTERDEALIIRDVFFKNHFFAAMIAPMMQRMDDNVRRAQKRRNFHGSCDALMRCLFALRAAPGKGERRACAWLKQTP